MTVLSDNFDSYTPATNLVGQGNWGQTGTVTTNPVQVTADTTNGGNFASLGTSGQDVYKGFTNNVPHTDGESIETTFALTASAAATNGDYFLHLSSPLATSSNFYERTFAKAATGGFVLGLSDTTTAASYGTTVLALNTPHTVDTVWNFVPGAANDTFTMTVDGQQYLTYTWTATTAEPTDLEAFNLRQGTAANAPTLTVDDVSVAASNIPEPASMAGLGLLGLVVVRRGRRSQRVA